jgi:DNA-binding PadR family transcriptional regulator
MVYRDLICPKKDILYLRPTAEPSNKNTGGKMNHKAREVQIKLMRGLLDLVVLQYLRAHPMHGYKIIASLRKNFGVYFGPSTIYPLLSTLEGNGYIKSHWDLQSERPRKVYSITPQGLELLACTEESLTHIYRKLSISISKIGINGNLGLLRKNNTKLLPKTQIVK